MATVQDALTAYRVCARAEGRSPRTIEWVTSSVGYFLEFLGGNAQIEAIGPNEFRGFINALRDCPRYRGHPYVRPQGQGLSETTINTYARGVRAFFGYLQREDFIPHNPLGDVRMPKVPDKVVPTFGESEIERLLSAPDRRTDRGFRDYAIMLSFYDTTCRLSELAGLRDADVDFEEGYLKVMGKGRKEHYVPFGQKVAKALMKYKIKHRPQPLATDRFWLTMDGRPLPPKRMGRIVTEYGALAGIGRCYPHKLRHTSSIAYLRKEGDPFTLQKKLGHSSLAMTRHYSNLADSDVRAAHLRHSPADRLRI